MQTLEPILAESPFFHGMKQEHLSEIAGCASNVRYEPGDFPGRAGDSADRFWVVRQGRMALEIMHRLRDSIRLMIVDIRLPDMSGAQLVKEAAAHIPVIYVSGDADSLPADIAASEQITLGLAKPFEMTQLVRHVRRLLTIAGEHRQPEAET